MSDLSPWVFVVIIVYLLVIVAVVAFYVGHKRRGDSLVDAATIAKFAGSILVLFAVGGTVQLLSFQIEQRKHSEALISSSDCQFRVNEALINVLSARSEARDGSDVALKDMAQAILNAKTSEESRAAIQRFIDAMNAYDAEKKEHPLPTIPNNCNIKQTTK